MLLRKVRMDRRRFLRVSSAALGSALLAPSATRLAAATATPPIALGAYVSGAPDNPALLDQFTSVVGVAPSVVMWYQDWAHSGFDATRMDAVASRGLMPMVTWEPWDYTLGTSQPAYSLAAIAGGTYDAYVQQWAQAARAWGKPFYLRLAHEMNGDWYPWGYGVNGNTAAQFVAAWQRLWRHFQAVGATNVRWVWCPNVAGRGKHGSASNAFSSFYPGDGYVGWIGLDGYNWGTTQPWSSWQDLATVFGASYGPITRLTTKPLMIGEMASAEAGGNKANWITTGLGSTIPAKFPRIRAVIWFDENKETDWRVESSAASLAAYRQVAMSATYRGVLP
jgi:beta-mannanase